jgi:MATE family multidrug resistance protein
LAGPAGRGLPPVPARALTAVAAASTAARLPPVDAAALLRLAAPIVLAQLAVLGLSLADTIMAGRLSARDLAAVGVGSAIYVTVYIVGLGVLTALTPIAGHHYGAGRTHEIGTDLGQTLWLAALLSALGVPVLLAGGSLLRAAGVPPEVAAIAERYLWGEALGLPAWLASRAYVALNSAVSRPRVTLVVQLAALAVKVPLNWLFIHGAGPLPALGGAGCGLATGVLGWIVVGLCWAVWRFDPYFRRFHARRRHGPLWARQRELLRLGLPSGGSLFSEVTSFSMISILLAPLGADVMAGHQIVLNLVSVLFMVPLGLGIATSVLVAQSLGAGEPARARAAAWRGWRITVAVAALAAASLFLARRPLIGLFTNDAEVIGVALGLLGLAALFHVFDAMQGVAGFILRGYKVALAPMLVYGAALWGIGLAGGYLLAYAAPAPWPFKGAAGFWAASGIGLVVAGASLSALAARVARRHLMQK